jgi:uncharacterized caspase-like protein
MRAWLAWIHIGRLTRMARSAIGAGAIAVAVIVGTAAHAADPEARVALVIGIGAYQNAPPLANPVNDAKRMSEALRRLNFDVIELLDPDIRKLTRTLREFGIRAQNADAALVFYAGHGVQVDRENYLLPVDARLERERDLLYEALSLELVLGEASQAKKVGIVILDACRNNPFAARMLRSSGLTRSISRGLAPVEPEGGVLVAYSAKHGTVAEDGTGTMSPFAEAFVALVEEPGVEINFLFRRVRDRVLTKTGRRQEPFLYGSLPAESLYFRPTANR